MHIDDKNCLQRPSPLDDPERVNFANEPNLSTGSQARRQRRTAMHGENLHHLAGLKRRDRFHVGHVGSRSGTLTGGRGRIFFSRLVVRRSEARFRFDCGLYLISLTNNRRDVSFATDSSSEHSIREEMLSQVILWDTGTGYRKTESEPRALLVGLGSGVSGWENLARSQTGRGDFDRTLAESSAPTTPLLPSTPQIKSWRLWRHFASVARFRVAGKWFCDRHREARRGKAF